MAKPLREIIVVWHYIPDSEATQSVLRFLIAKGANLKEAVANEQ